MAHKVSAPDLATLARTGVRFLGWPRVALGAWLPTALLITVAVLTVTPVAVALLTGFRDAPPGRTGAISWASIQASFGVMAQPEVWQILWTTVWLSTVRAVLDLALAVLLAWTIPRTCSLLRTSRACLLVL